MDQGNTDPNNQNPSAPSSFGVDSTIVPPTVPPPIADQPGTAPTVTPPPAGGSSWANPTAQPEAAVPPVSPSPFPADQSQGLPPTEFNPFSAPAAEAPSTTPLSSSETAPTDLSNLASTSETTSYIPQTDATSNMGMTQPESLVVTPSAPVDTAQSVAVTSGSKGFPKILIAIGAVSLLVVIAASAYFILGIGKPSEPAPVSVPALQATPTTVATPTPVASTSSASFSNLPGTSATPVTGGGNAYQLLLQQKQAATSSANP